MSLGWDFPFGFLRARRCVECQSPFNLQEYATGLWVCPVCADVLGYLEYLPDFKELTYALLRQL